MTIRAAPGPASRASPVDAWLHAALAEAPLALWAVGQEGVFRFAHGEAARHFGFPTVGSAEGRSMEELWAHEPELAHDARRALAGEAVARLHERRGRSWEVRWTPAPDRVGAAVGLALEVTARLRAEAAENLWEAREAEVQRLQQERRSRSEFLRRAARELNVPLTPLALEARLLASDRLGPRTERQARALGVLTRDLERLELLVQDMLDAADLQDDRLRLTPGPTDLAAVARALAEAWRGAAEARGVRVEVAAPEHAPVWADERRLKQVVSNLLSNAVKHTAPGTAVNVALEVQPEHRRAVVRVQDEGPGLDAEQRERVFLPFAEAPGAAGVPAGRGLGLFLSQGIVQAHGGRLWADSPGPGRGATFTFTVPLDPPAAPPRRPRTPPVLQSPK